MSETQPTAAPETTSEHQSDVDAVRGLLDLMADFSDNDQRARYLLSCNWMIERGAHASGRARRDLEKVLERNATIRDDEHALDEISWVMREARALIEEGAGPGTCRWLAYQVRKRALLAYVDAAR